MTGKSVNHWEERITMGMYFNGHSFSRHLLLSSHPSSCSDPISLLWRYPMCDTRTHRKQCSESLSLLPNCWLVIMAAVFTPVGSAKQTSICTLKYECATPYSNTFIALFFHSYGEKISSRNESLRQLYCLNWPEHILCCVTSSSLERDPCVTCLCISGLYPVANDPTEVDTALSAFSFQRGGGGRCQTWGKRGEHGILISAELFTIMLCSLTAVASDDPEALALDKDFEYHWCSIRHHRSAHSFHFSESAWTLRSSFMEPLTVYIQRRQHSKNVSTNDRTSRSFQPSFRGLPWPWFAPQVSPHCSRCFVTWLAIVFQLTFFVACIALDDARQNAKETRWRVQDSNIRKRPQGHRLSCSKTAKQIRSNIFG